MPEWIWSAGTFLKGTGLITRWIPVLYRRLKKIRRKRELEFQRLADIAGGSNPVYLARLYIEPEVQLINPAEHRDASSPIKADRKGFRRQINNFLDREFEVKDGRHVLFLLAGAGMGKTTALVMLYVSQFCDFWPTGVKFELLKLGETTLNEVRDLPEKPKTVLLLDSLDEDPLAYVDLKDRLVEILDMTTSFRQVILTCRTQFFPNPRTASDKHHPFEEWARIEVGGFDCGLLYLAPFSNAQASMYLSKKFPLWSWERVKSRLRGKGSFHQRALALTKSMGSLTMRPLLMVYVEDLLRAGVDSGNQADVYEQLVGIWIEREVRKLRRALGKVVEAQELREICEELAVYLHSKNLRTVSEAKIRSKMSLKALETLKPIDVGGRSLLNRVSDGSFQFAHKSIQDYLSVYVFCAQKTRARLNADQISFCRIWTKLEIERRVNRYSQPTRDEAPAQSKNFVAPESRILTAAGKDDLGPYDLQEFDFSDAFLAGAEFQLSNLQRASFERSVLQEAQFRKSSLNDASFANADLRRASFFEAILEGADLSKADLKRADLSRADLSGANLEGAALSWADYREAKFARANLKNLDLRGANFSNTDFRNANLCEVNLEKAILHGANLVGADLSRAQLQDVQLENAHLSDACFDGADLKGVSLEAADLAGVSFNDADLRGAILSMANLRGTLLKAAKLSDSELRGSSLNDANLSEADLDGADLEEASSTGARFYKANLQRARFRRGELKRADFVHADLSRAVLREADLTEVDLSRANLFRANLVQADLRGANLRGANLRRANLYGADLTGADLSGADLFNSYLYGANFKKAKLRSADLRMAELSKVWNLKQEQIESAIGNVETLLPKHLFHPTKWA